MKRSLKLLIAVCCLAMFAMIYTGCSNARIHTSAGVNMSFGPGGPHVSPSFNVGVYGGGRR